MAGVKGASGGRRRGAGRPRKTDAERLDVFNGFLLSANLDALFDRFLISFDEQGALVTAPALEAAGGWQCGEGCGPCAGSPERG